MGCELVAESLRNAVLGSAGDLQDPGRHVGYSWQAMSPDPVGDEPAIRRANTARDKGE